MRGIKVKTTFPYLKCVKEIESCPDLAIGDLLWGSEHREIWLGGYEYCVCTRRDDGHVFKFRVEHLEDCFETAEIEEERYI